jgi:glycosyltransferase involved in cell wall biosynthesis
VFQVDDIFFAMKMQRVSDCHKNFSKLSQNREELRVPLDTVEISELELTCFSAGKKQLRIAFVTETYPPDVNGVAKTLQRIVEGLQALGHEIWLVRPKLATASAQTGAVKNQVFVRGMPIPMYPELKLGLPAKRALIRLWTMNRPDVVHIATEGPLGWSAVQAAKKLKLPMTSDFRTNFHAYSAFYGFSWLKSTIASYMRRFHNATQCTMVPTEELRQSLSSAGFLRLIVVPRGIDTELYTPKKRCRSLRLSWGANDETIVMLSVGRLAAEKNLDLTIRAYEAARKESSRVLLVFVGDGPLRQKLEKDCPGAVFCGVQHGDDLAAHYASADIFLFPSLTETFGNVTLEALASGLSVVAFDCAAARQLISSGENGLLAPAGDTSTFIRHSVELVLNPDIRGELGSSARELSLRNGWSAVIERTEAVLLKVSNSSHTSFSLPPDFSAGTLECK